MDFDQPKSEKCYYELRNDSLRDKNKNLQRIVDSGCNCGGNKLKHWSDSEVTDSRVGGRSCDSVEQLGMV